MLDKQLTELSRVLYADLDTPISLGVYLRQKYGEWDQYLAMRPDPAHYLDTALGANKYFRDAQAIELLRKYPKLPVRIDREQVAKDGFWAAEKQCGSTNERLKPYILNWGLTPEMCRIADFIDGVKRRVRKILGRLPADLNIRFGPGATFESKGHPFAHTLTVADKMTMRPCVTKDAIDLLPFVYNTAWGRALMRSGLDSAPVVVRGNRFTTVPKDATKDRGICIEPGALVAMQLAIGKYIRRRLRLFGIDLKNGQDTHRALARLGSLAGEIATMDLSSASDTVAKKLVELLLPEEWFTLLDGLRSPMTKIDGKWVRLEKFSSMGNGFTFELETLLFLAIVCEACNGTAGKDVWVYGDDILYPSCRDSDVSAALRFFGFTPNARKSFSRGSFRESCGGDFFAGYPVRCYYLDKEVNEPHEWISVANGMRRAAIQVSGQYHRRARKRALGNLPVAIRKLRGPVVLGDLVIHEHDHHKWDAVERNQMRFVRVWRPVLKRVKLSNFPPEIQFATALYGSAEGQRSNAMERALAVSLGGPPPREVIVSDAYLTPRNGVTGYRFGRVAYS